MTEFQLAPLKQAAKDLNANVQAAIVASVDQNGAPSFTHYGSVTHLLVLRECITRVITKTLEKGEQLSPP